ncbi:class I SAM-dependent methyltransferase [Granulosicoccus sp. 3-233]|uniref:class I SAM-dependent methyltransferase n=1 Tax=Granulosicoccus sp. 3-233 TaxID=3417969 RepID=UPI003D32CBEB
MADPFQDIDAVDSRFLDVVVAALEARAAEEQMVQIIERYLDSLNWVDGATHVEVGAGTGPIARRMAARAGAACVIAMDPSVNLVKRAATLAEHLDNLECRVGGGEQLAFDTGSIDSIVMHTVLSHVIEPEILLKEACRVLKPGGKIVICDADFEKTSLGNFAGDPLDSCARFFVDNVVTQPYLISNLRQLIVSAGFLLDEFRVDSRAITDTDGGMAWVRMGTALMVERGLIAQALADALADEYLRRKEAGTLYGHQPFGTVIATRP